MGHCDPAHAPRPLMGRFIVRCLVLAKVHLFTNVEVSTWAASGHFGGQNHDITTAGLTCVVPKPSITCLSVVTSDMLLVTGHWGRVITYCSRKAACWYAESVKKCTTADSGIGESSCTVRRIVSHWWNRSNVRPSVRLSVRPSVRCQLFQHPKTAGPTSTKLGRYILWVWRQNFWEEEFWSSAPAPLRRDDPPLQGWFWCYHTCVWNSPSQIWRSTIVSITVTLMSMVVVLQTSPTGALYWYIYGIGLRPAEKSYRPISRPLSCNSRCQIHTSLLRRSLHQLINFQVNVDW